MKKRKILSVLLAAAISAVTVFTAASAALKPGDMNADGKVNSDDAIYLLYHVFFSEDYPLPEAGKEGETVYNDTDVINKSTITSYCNTNETLIPSKTEVKGIIVELPGLGGSSCLGGSVNMGNYVSEFTNRCARNGIVVAYMFPGPWAWGNKASVRMTDSVVKALADKYSLGDDFPLVVCGGSMGGLGSLIYAADTSLKANLKGVMSACPCVDVLDRFDASASYPRSFVSAVASYNMPLTDALKTISPVERIADMAKVPYFIASDGADEVFPEAQCDSYVEKLKDAGFNVTYRKQPNKKHGEFIDSVSKELHDFMMEMVLCGEDEIGTGAVTDDELTITKAEQISSTQLRITFSEPVSMIGGKYTGIRYTGVGGIGVLWIDDFNNCGRTPIQFGGSMAAETATTYIWTLSKPEPAFTGITTIDRILNKEGVLYGLESPVRFCIEESPPEGLNKHPGHVETICAVSDSSKYLKADQFSGENGWEGAYVDIVPMN